MPRPVVCPQCREELDIPAEFRGSPVRCSACNSVFTPPAAAEEPPVAPRRVRRPADDDEFDSDRPRRPAPRRSFVWLWVLLAGSLGTCCVGCGGVIAWAVSMDNPTLKPYTSADGKYQTGFPGDPVVGLPIQAFDGKSTTTPVEWRRTILGNTFETYYVHATDLKTPPSKAEAARLVTKAANDLARRPGSAEQSRQPAATAGRDGVEVVIRHPDDELTLARVFTTADRVYVVGITGKGLDPQNSQRIGLFWDAFKLTEVAPDKVKPDAAADPPDDEDAPPPAKKQR